MKMAFLSVLVALTVAAPIVPAAASDMPIETETYTSHVKLDIETVTYSNDAYRAPQATTPCGTRRVASSLDLARPCAKPCMRPCARTAAPAPVHVKTHSEVIDYYTVYQPVITYRPAGTYAHRRVVPACNRCGK